MKPSLSTVFAWIKAGDLVSLSRALEKFPSLSHEKDDVGNTPLMQAVFCQQIECARRLLPLSDPTMRAGDGETLLHLAIEAADKVEMVSLLLSACDPLALDAEQCNALMFAIREERPNCIRLLLEASPTAARQQDVSGNTALLLATRTKTIHCLELLLPYSDASMKNDKLTTALMSAAAQGRLEDVRTLLPHSPINAKDFDGRTALMHAAHNGHVSTVNVLLPESRTYLQDCNGNTALHLAAFADHGPCVKALLQKTDPTLRNSVRCTPFEAALGARCLSSIDAILSEYPMGQIPIVLKQYDLTDELSQLPQCSALLEREKLRQSLPSLRLPKQALNDKNDGTLTEHDAISRSARHSMRL